MTVAFPSSPSDAGPWDRLIGIPWAAGAQGPDAYDCWAFAAMVQRLHFGSGLLPLGGYGDLGPRLIALARRAWEVVERPRHGDMVELRRMGAANHVGVWLDIDRGGVLHCQRGAGVCFDGLGDIRLMGWRPRYWRPSRLPLEPFSHRPKFGPRGAYVADIGPLLEPGHLGRVDAVLAGHRAIPIAAATGDTVAAIVARAGLDRAAVIAFVRPRGAAPVPIDPAALATEEGLSDALARLGLVRRCGWDDRALCGDEDILLQQIPMGGQGSNPLALVLQLVVLVAAVYFAPVLAPALVGALGLTTAAATGLAVAAINIVGGLAINALLPAPSPTGLRGGLQSDVSPTYSASAQGSVARPGAPVPVCFGRHIHQLDDAAPPYVRYTGNVQVLFQLLCLGEGQHALEEIRIGETAILRAGVATANIPGVTFQHLAPAQPVTLIDDAVYTHPDVTGQALEPETASAFQIATPSGIETEQIEIDIGFSQLVAISSGGGNLNTTVDILVEAQTVDADDAAVGAVFTLGTITVTDNTRAALRLTRRFVVPEGRYRVRLTRTTAEGDDQTFDDAFWIGLKAILPGGRTYGDVELLALRIEVGEQIAGQTARRVSAVKTRKLPVYAAGAWTAPQPTREIAWAIAQVMRSHGRLADLDLDELLALHATWSARGDRVDVVIDQEMSFWEALQGVCRAGRAQPDQIGNRVRIWRDEPRALPRQLFGDTNIRRGSLVIRPTLPTRARPPRLVAEFMDEATWRVAEVAVGAADGAERRERYFGIATRRQITDEVAHDFRASRFRGVRVAFDVELEGRLLRRGDLIAVAHRQLGRAQAVGIEAWAGGLVTFRAAVDWAALTGATQMVLSAPDGSVWGPVTIAEVASDDGRLGRVSAAGLAELVAGGGDDPATWMTPGDGRDEPIRGMVGTATDTYLRLIVESVGAERSGRATVTGIEDDPRAHDGAVPVPGVAAPRLVGLDATRRDEGGLTLIDLVGVLAPGDSATGYLVEVSTDGAASFAPATSSATPVLTITTAPGITHVRMAALGQFRGPWIAVAVSAETVAAPTGLVETTPGQYVALGSLRVQVTPASGAAAYQWRLIPDGGAVAYLRRTATPTLVVTGADLVAAGARARSLVVRAKAISASGGASAEVALTLTNAAPAAPTGLAVGAGLLTWDSAPAADVIGWDVRFGLGGGSAAAARPIRVTTPQASAPSGASNIVEALVAAVDRVGAGPAASLTYGTPDAPDGGE